MTRNGWFKLGLSIVIAGFTIILLLQHFKYITPATGWPLILFFLLLNMIVSFLRPQKYDYQISKRAGWIISTAAIVVILVSLYIILINNDFTLGFHILFGFFVLILLCTAIDYILNRWHKQNQNHHIDE